MDRDRCLSPCSGGASAFAFQGTNAHAVLSVIRHGASTALPGSPEAWTAGTPHARRHWPLPPAHALLRHATVLAAANSRGSATLVLDADAAAPGLAFLRDHRVRGLALLPATAMTEMFAGAASTVLQAGTFVPRLPIWTASCYARHTACSSRPDMEVLHL